MAKKGPSWWYLHIGIKLGSLRRAVRRGRLFFRAFRWLFSSIFISNSKACGGTLQKKKRYGSAKRSSAICLNGKQKVSNRAKNPSIGTMKTVKVSDNSKTKLKSIDYGGTGIIKTANVECSVSANREKIIPSLNKENDTVFQRADEQAPSKQQAITSWVEQTEIEDSSERKPLTIEEMKAFKLSIVKEGENDVKPIIMNGNETIGTLWKENIDRFFADHIAELREGKRCIDAVKNLEVSKGRITAEVKGAHVVAYKIIITIEPLTEMQIKSFYEGGENQRDLFPTKKDFWLFCNCDIQKNICEHMIATLYAVGNLMDQDRTVIYRLRGL